MGYFLGCIIINGDFFTGEFSDYLLEIPASDGDLTRFFYLSMELGDKACLIVIAMDFCRVPFSFQIKS